MSSCPGDLNYVRDHADLDTCHLILETGPLDDVLLAALRERMALLVLEQASTPPPP